MRLKNRLEGIEELTENIEGLDTHLSHLRDMVRDFNHLQEKTVKLFERALRNDCTPEEVEELKELSNATIEKYYGDKGVLN